MNNDAASHDLAHLLSLVREQLQDLPAMRQRRSSLTAKASAANGTVEVTVDARHCVVKTVIDESYLQDFDLAALGDHVTKAARQAAQDVEQQTIALQAPLADRRSEILSLSRLVADTPAFHDAITGLRSNAPGESRHASDEDDGFDDFKQFPVVRR
ncbi:YbaB/EbfC family nucleoid-associated protein [Mycobacterium simiae]|uniref:YbaB/EbfC family nucleoid-associated protein n=1 Tax=Mycobacterium simiae TaxID=1784 RepID=UPI000420D6E5|nr:YbaB/EbfC family nucleoid-associated protein [Mycobacterium simiae]PLV50471.1 hypothetical protein X011_13435 [Mycobacterium tuberculosis variant microti OV254]BBX43407.1 hypothetical protein MSIM_48580 [Mycobacterium simiae]